ncbi:NUDIX hydrolase [Tardiphaga sp. 42S5]|uniref:NUDIX hydrolase n=1 Tax=Tardiphaga sp. 42S5 TaxID=1404799 RepID=UPI002A59F7B7|nr:NUDIX domain-containing protein [Tardiphaga sp. 42S5]WPO39385.1 NUDIX domain-containing protein [Tardiphaga sp. 42S5]
MMRVRSSSRLLIVDSETRVLLFRFVHKTGALAGQNYWSTPGGGVKDGETYQQAAIRELREETGILRESVGEPVADREFALQLPDGDYVQSREKYFVVRVEDVALSRQGWTSQEVDVIADQRWWSRGDLMQTTEEVVWPENLLDILATVTIN